MNENISKPLFSSSSVFGAVPSTSTIQQVSKPEEKKQGQFDASSNTFATPSNSGTTTPSNAFLYGAVGGLKQNENKIQESSTSLMNSNNPFLSACNKPFQPSTLFTSPAKPSDNTLVGSHSQNMYMGRGSSNQNKDIFAPIGGGSATSTIGMGLGAGAGLGIGTTPFNANNNAGLFNSFNQSSNFGPNFNQPLITSNNLNTSNDEMAISPITSPKITARSDEINPTKSNLFSGQGTNQSFGLNSGMTTQNNLFNPQGQSNKLFGLNSSTGNSTTINTGINPPALFGGSSTSTSSGLFSSTPVIQNQPGALFGNNNLNSGTAISGQSSLGPSKVKNYINF
jgi:hypothetical protein